jgi:hypothetical protein
MTAETTARALSGALTLAAEGRPWRLVAGARERERNDHLLGRLPCGRPHKAAFGLVDA